MAKSNKPIKIFDIELTIGEYKKNDPVVQIRSNANEFMVISAIPMSKNSILIEWTDYSKPTKKKKK